MIGKIMQLPNTFDEEETFNLVDQFENDGYVILDVDDYEMLITFRHHVVDLVCAALGVQRTEDDGDFLNNFFTHCPVDKLNEVRLLTYNTLNSASWSAPTYFQLAKRSLHTLLGNELAMQRKINLSVQFPNDDSSLLPIHADVFGGETPFQIVQWLPLVDCFKSKSMFIAPKKLCDTIYPMLVEYQQKGMDQLFEDIKDELIWLDVPFGKVLIFSPNFLHGNIINTESSVRWSMNCRFKGLFTPYTGAEKKLGSFYKPITIKPVTKIGLNYTEPSGFSE